MDVAKLPHKGKEEEKMKFVGILALLVLSSAAGAAEPAKYKAAKFECLFLR